MLSSEYQITRRIRINVSTSVKGQHTYDCTVELAEATAGEVLAESDAINQLDLRYPPSIEKSKEEK